MVGKVGFEAYSQGLPRWEGAKPAPVTEDREEGWGTSSFSAEPERGEIGHLQTAGVSWGPLVVIGAVALAGGIARLIHSRHVRKRDAARIEDILTSGVRRVAENSKVGIGQLDWISSEQQIRPDQFVPAIDSDLLATFSSRSWKLVGDFSMMLDFDRRAATRVGRLAPTSFLMKYCQGGDPLKNRWRVREMDDVLHLAYNDRHLEASNKHDYVQARRPYVETISEWTSMENRLVGGLHSIVAAQLAAQEGHVEIDPDEQAKIFRAARYHVDLAIDAFSSGELGECIGLLDRHGMNVIQKQTKALRFDINVALRDAEGRPPRGTENPVGLFGRFPSSAPFQVINGGVAAKFSSIFPMPVFRPITVR